MIPDDVLIDAARMFYPDIKGLDTYAICADALHRMRAQERIEGLPNSEALARWRATDPVCIAYFAMMFIQPLVAGDEAYHPWFGRLMQLKKEREKRFTRSSNGCQ